MAKQCKYDPFPIVLESLLCAGKLLIRLARGGMIGPRLRTASDRDSFALASATFALLPAGIFRYSCAKATARNYTTFAGDNGVCAKESSCELSGWGIPGPKYHDFAWFFRARWYLGNHSVMVWLWPLAARGGPPSPKRFNAFSYPDPVGAST